MDSLRRDDAARPRRDVSSRGRKRRELRRQAAALAAELGCDAVVGHSLGANVALEMVVSGEFSGAVVLLSPSFAVEDESKFLPMLDRLSSVLGHLPYVLMLKMTAPMMRRSLPEQRRDALLAELKKNDARTFGEHDEVNLADAEREVLERCPTVSLVTIAGAGHLTLNQKPAEVAELVLAAVAATRM